MNQLSRDQKSERRFVFWFALIFGTLVGLIAGFGVIIHDEKSWTEGALAGLGLFAFGFAIMYLRYARRIAELLSIFH